MKPILSILLINIIFVALCQIGEPIESSESLLSEKEMNDFRESLNKIKKIEKYLRKLEVDTSESGEESEESESSGEEPPVNPPENQTVIPTDVPAEDVSEKREAAVHIKKLNSLKNKTNSNNPQKPVLFEFNLFIEFTNIKPYKTVRFTLIIYRSRLRELQDGNQNVEKTEAVCTRNDTFQDINTKYDCQADATEASANPEKIETVKDFQVTTDDSAEPIKLDVKELDFSPTAKEALEDLTMPQSSAIYIVDIKDATVTVDSKYQIFYIKGSLVGEKANDLAEPGQSIIFKFRNGTMDGTKYDTSCKVENEATNNFILKCDKPSDFYGDLYIYKGYGTLNDVDIFVNPMKGNDTVPFPRPSEQNVVYRKNSSGLSGGAIAGIVIVCAAVLIIITVLAIYLKGPKTPVNNNSTIVGLKSVENY